jgi:hypothetical protein
MWLIPATQPQEADWLSLTMKTVPGGAKACGGAQTFAPSPFQ